MGQAVEQRCGHLGVAEDGRSFAEAQGGGDDHAGPCVEYAQQVEEERSARGAERQVAQFVYYTAGDCAGICRVGRITRSSFVRLSASCPAFPLALSCSRVLTSSIVEKKRTLRR